jgi:hypothetical protein
MRRKRWLVCVGLILLGWGLMPGIARAQGAEINSFTVAGEPPSSGGSGGQTSGGGDLFIQITWYGGAWAWHHDDNVSLWMRIFVENQLVAEQYHHGTWYITGGVTPPSAPARRIEASHAMPMARWPPASRVERFSVRARSRYA